MATPDPSLAIRLREARRGVGLSQQEVADALSVSRRAVSEWETGNRRPHVHLPELARVYDVTTSWLLNGAEEASVEVRELRNEVATLTETVNELYEQVVQQGQKTADVLAVMLELAGLDPPADEPAPQPRAQTSAAPRRRAVALSNGHAAQSRRAAKERPERGAS